MNNSNNEKEIDLLEVSGNIFISIKNGIKALALFVWKCVEVIYYICLSFSKLIIKNWLYFLAATIIAIGCSFYLYKTNKPIYKLEGYATSSINANEDILQIINSISTENNDLNLDAAIAKKIKTIKGSWLIDTNNDGIADYVDYKDKYQQTTSNGDTIATRIKNRFNIKLHVEDQTIGDEIESALIEYLNSNSYIKKINNIRIEKNKAMLNTLASQTQILDSLQYYEYFVEQAEMNKLNQLGGVKFGDFEIVGSAETKEKRLYHNDIINLKNNAIALENSLTFDSEAITFISNICSNGNRINNIIHYLLRVSLILIPLTILLFAIFRKDELIETFNINAKTQDTKNKNK